MEVKIAVLEESENPSIEEWIYEQGKSKTQFRVPRSYGYAVYRIIGGYEMWKITRDAMKFYISVNSDVRKWFPQKSNVLEKREGYEIYVIAVVRGGGYDRESSPGLPSLGDLFAQAGFVEEGV